MEFRVLGPLEVLDDRRLLDLGAPRQRALFAFLLLHANEVVSTDRLAEALWPEAIPRTAAKAIQVYVSALRKALGGARDVLETRGSGYVLRVAPGELDEPVAAGNTVAVTLEDAAGSDQPTSDILMSADV